MILWGTYKLNITSNDCTPAEETISEVKVVPQPAQILITDEHQILTNEDIIALHHSPILENSEFVTGPLGTPIYVKDTDYAINYTLGQINRIASGSMINIEDCYISYTYLTNAKNTILMGVGRERRKVNLDCWANFSEYAALENDYRNRTKKILTLDDGTTFQALIFKIPNTVKVAGLPKKTFSITFIEA